MRTLAGTGLHSGRPCSVTLSRASGPIRLSADGAEAALDELVVTRTDRGLEVALGEAGPRVDAVEHLLASLGGLGIGSGVHLAVSGGEVPLLDGGASAFCRALRELGAAREPRRLVVIREDEIRVETSRYSFAPGASTEVRVEIAFDAPGIGVQRAAWNGLAESFEEDVAWARTFGFRRDGAALVAAGRARGASPDAVMILDDLGYVEPPGRGARPNEPALHKLLDLVGDATLYGGPPLGTVSAVRPGHGATHRAFREALERGALRLERT